MALIYCPECGEKMSDKAASCPHCGCPRSVYFPEKKPAVGHIKIFWKGHPANNIRKTLVRIDDIEVGVLKSGGSLSYDVPYGDHPIELWQGQRCLLTANAFVDETYHSYYYAFKEEIGLYHPVLKRADNVYAIEHFTATPPPVKTVSSPQRNYTYPPKSKGVAFLLCLFLGYIGAHRFYVGKFGTGLIWLCSGGLLGIGWLLDLVVILFGGFRDKLGQKLA